MIVARAGGAAYLSRLYGRYDEGGTHHRRARQRELTGWGRCIHHVTLLMSFSDLGSAGYCTVVPVVPGPVARWRSTVAVTWCIQRQRISAEWRRGRLHFADISICLSIPLNGLFMAIQTRPINSLETEG